MRTGTLAAAAALSLAPGSAAFAQSMLAQPQAADVSGAWQVTGAINAGAAVASATPVCTFTLQQGGTLQRGGKQTGAPFAGACEGPHARGPVTGTVAGRHITWQWRASPRTLVGMDGVSIFTGDLGADNVIHGTWTASQLPGASGTFSARRR